MKTSSPDEITDLLVAWSQGDQQALERLAPLVERELRRLARSYLRRESPGNLLQTTALINEAYARLLQQNRVQWRNRAQFFGVSAQLMRRILVDFARQEHLAKRGGTMIRVTFEDASLKSEPRSVDLIALDQALEKLRAIDARRSRIVELRFFGGLTIEETAEVIGVSPGTVRNEWSLARAWLYRELKGGGADGG
jgi:RNA polymerase sigma factor (TIGR02999 family)